MDILDATEALLVVHPLLDKRRKVVDRDALAAIALLFFGLFTTDLRLASSVVVVFLVAARATSRDGARSMSIAFLEEMSTRIFAQCARSHITPFLGLG